MLNVNDSDLWTLETNLRGHVRALASEIGERNIFRAGTLERAARFIRDFWEALGYEVLSQAYEVRGTTCENFEVRIEGTERPHSIVVIGAHYDSVMGSPGANDNASGVAALLEISRLFCGRSDLGRSLRFVTFVNEEPPFFMSGEMGSQVYAHEARRRGEKIAAMLSLETIGYFTDRPRSQNYPPPFGLFYPHQGNFIGFVGNIRSRGLVREVKRLFKMGADFPCESIALPSLVPGVDWSDHASFWQEGYPAVMVTDTALYRYPHYHEPTDRPEFLSYPEFARVTRGLAAVVEGLTN